MCNTYIVEADNRAEAILKVIKQRIAEDEDYIDSVIVDFVDNEIL